MFDLIIKKNQSYHTYLHGCNVFLHDVQSRVGIFILVKDVQNESCVIYHDWVEGNFADEKVLSRKISFRSTNHLVFINETPKVLSVSDVAIESAAITIIYTAKRRWHIYEIYQTGALKQTNVKLERETLQTFSFWKWSENKNKMRQKVFFLSKIVNI